LLERPAFERFFARPQSARRGKQEIREERFMQSPAPKSAVEAQPLIAVRDVRASSRWYSDLLGADSLPEHSHRDFYDRISCSGRLLLQLHAWDKEDHPNLVNAAAAPVGHGTVLWFQVEDFDSAMKRVDSLGAEVIEGPYVNPAPQHREIWVRDPDGFVVVLASPDGECSP
jgi:catechol 2,3-dioxygenase-like lactoylglutathione lyase family enzyme